MAYEDLKTASTEHEMDDIHGPETDFYETMPMYEMPHTIYRDDDDQFLDDARRLEIEKQRTRIVSILTLAMAVIVAAGLLLVIGYALISLNDTASPSSSSSGSLEL